MPIEESKAPSGLHNAQLAVSMSGRAMLCALQVREVSESGRRSYEAYIMAPGVSKDNIKWGTSLHTTPATPCLYL